MPTKLSDIKVQVDIIIGRADLKISQILKMGRGAIIPFRTTEDDPVQILANNELVAHGTIVINDDRVGIEIIDAAVSGDL